MRYNFFPVYVILIVFFSCSKKNTTSNSQNTNNSHKETTQIKDTILTASDIFTGSSCAYLTYDNEKNPVLCWTGTDKDSNTYIWYSIFDNSNNTFPPGKKIVETKGATPQTEAQSKLAFKSDGTIIAASWYRTKSEVNYYAGELRYVFSADKGNTWSQQKRIHAETGPHVGRNFVDLKTLSDGEVGASWLGIETVGRPITFAKTNVANEFTGEIIVDEAACECCRTILKSDLFGNIYIAYRDRVEIDETKQVRDMVIVKSTDMGLSFSKPQPIHQDNWIINGCPHTGPDMSISANGNILAVWYSGAEANNGVFLMAKEKERESFTNKSIIGLKSQHPQIEIISNDKAVIVWDESLMDETTDHNSTHGSSNKLKSYNRIGITLVSKGSPQSASYITDEKSEAEYPVVCATKSGDALIAWTQKENGNLVIKYKVHTIN